MTKGKSQPTEKNECGRRGKNEHFFNLFSPFARERTVLQKEFTMKKVNLIHQKENIPTYIPKLANTLPMFFEKKPYQRGHRANCTQSRIRTVSPMIEYYKAYIKAVRDLDPYHFDLIVFDAQKEKICK